MPILAGYTLVFALFLPWFAPPSTTTAGEEPQMPIFPHVLTSSRVGYESKPGRPWSVYAPYLDWAQTDPPYAAGAHAAGIKTMWYTNPNRQMPGQNMFTQDETTFAHDCSGNRIHGTQDPRLELMQPSSATLAALWLALSQAELLDEPYTAVLEDDTDDVWGVNAMPCNYDQNNWLNWSLAETGVLAAAGVPVIYNGLSPMGPGPSISPNIAFNSVTIGGMMEDCYIRPAPGNELLFTPGWEVVENTEIQMGAQKKLFFCYADDYLRQSSGAISQRIYAFASFLLSYRPWTSVYQTNFTNMNDFNVMPESLIVPEQPTTWPQSASDMLTPTGAYGRQYRACYLHGQLVGRCAAAVNPDGFHAHAFPYQGYRHTMVISGSDIVDGGRVSVNGNAPPSDLAPLTAVVAFP